MSSQQLKDSSKQAIIPLNKCYHRHGFWNDSADLISSRDQNTIKT